MAVGWASAGTSTGLTLTNSYQDVQESAADLEITLDPNQFVELQIEVNFQASPTDDGEWQILSSPDGGTTYDTDPIDSGQIDNGTDPARQTTRIFGVHTIKIQGRQTGATDTTNSMTVRYRVATMS